MEIIPPQQWHDLVTLLLHQQGVVLLLGSTDTGKSTLARYLITALVSSGRVATLVDADIGQSSLALPGTVSLKTFRSPQDVTSFQFDLFSFLGSVNPVNVMPLLIAETCRFAALGRRSAAVTVIDTTGLVVGDLGRTLKKRKIQQVRPDLIIAIESEHELGHILTHVGDIPVVRLKPSPMVRARRPETRSRYRTGKLVEYFAIASEMLINSPSMEFYFHGKAIRHDDSRVEPGTLVGLNYGPDTAGLGVVTEVDAESLVVRTPLRSLKHVRRIVVGTMTTA